MASAAVENDMTNIIIREIKKRKKAKKRKGWFLYYYYSLLQ